MALASVFTDHEPIVGMAVSAVATLLAIALATLIFGDDKPYSGIPIIGMGKGIGKYRKARSNYIAMARTLFKEGIQETKGAAFQVLTDLGFMIILPPSFVDEIRNIPHLTFGGFIDQNLNGNIPGFGAFHTLNQGDIFQETVRTKLTSQLAHITDALSIETKAVLDTRLPASNDWKEDVLHDTAVTIAAQLSSRVFLGEKICRDPEWLRLSIEHAINGVMATRALRRWPHFLRPLVHWFLPGARQVRRDVAIGRKIIGPEIARRAQVKAKCAASGQTPPKMNDAIQWMEDVARGRPFDLVLGQLGISFAAIHTTSEFIMHLMRDLCSYPEYIELLREEIVTVLKGQGHSWKKTVLFELKLMDSFMKESQRVNVISSLIMNRKVRKTVKLSDGTVLPKDALLAIPTATMTDNATWPDADKFDGHRFLKLRQEPGNENKYQFVTTYPNHFGFGHGKHACPGRFLVSNQVKILLIHLLMKYDWKFTDDQGRPERIYIGDEIMMDPSFRILYKSRESEIEFPGE